MSATTRTTPVAWPSSRSLTTATGPRQLPGTGFVLAHALMVAQSADGHVGTQALAFISRRDGGLAPENGGLAAGKRQIQVASASHPPHMDVAALGDRLLAPARARESRARHPAEEGLRWRSARSASGRPTPQHPRRRNHIHAVQVHSKPRPHKATPTLRTFDPPSPTPSDASAKRTLGVHAATERKMLNRGTSSSAGPVRAP